MSLIKQLRWHQLHWRGRVLLLALILIALSLFNPHATLPKRVFDWYIVFDITQSMNVRDTANSESMSRLAFSKSAVRKSLASLPCGSRVALGLFTERTTTTITHPLEVCAHFSAIDSVVSQIDWRMAWGADSYIRNGLFNSIEQSIKLDKHMRLIFMSDGNQAPATNPDYAAAFDGTKGAVKGYVVGVGGAVPTGIPRLDDDDNITGYWELEDVMRYATFGVSRKTLSALDMENHHGRNAPHGSNPQESNNAHLSALDDLNLKNLANLTGMQYLHLNQDKTLKHAITSAEMGTWRMSKTDLRPLLILPALCLLVIFFIPTRLLDYISNKSYLTRYFNRKNMKKLA